MDFGNATLVQTPTGTWIITYNAENRPIRFENTETQTVVECAYDSQGRRFEKKVSIAGTVTLHHRYIYRGYLQIAALDLTRSAHPALWLVTWDPSQPTATRPLAIQKDGTWFTYGYDITKNICEVFGQHGYIRTEYSYAPFGAVTESGDVTQPFQWSSEHYDSELDLTYYNYRHYSPSLGRFLSRDPIQEQGGLNLYAFVENDTIRSLDVRGARIEGIPDYTLEEINNLPTDTLGQINANRPFGITLSSWYRGSHPSPLYRACYSRCYQVSSSGKPPILTLEMKSLDDYDTEEHELVHFGFFKNNWIIARDLLNSLEGVYCDSLLFSTRYRGKKNAGLAVKYGKNAVRFYEMKTKLQNVEYDWLAYGQVNKDFQMGAERARIQAELIKLEDAYNQSKKEFEQI